MKINIIESIIVVIISVLFSYACYSISNFDAINILLSITTLVISFIVLLFTFGVSLDGDKRKAGMIKTASGTFSGLFLIGNLVFAFYDFNIPTFIIVNGILLLLYALIVSSIWKADTK